MNNYFKFNLMAIISNFYFNVNKDIFTEDNSKNSLVSLRIQNMYIMFKLDDESIKLWGFYTKILCYKLNYKCITTYDMEF